MGDGMDWGSRLATLSAAERRRLEALIDQEGSSFNVFPLSYTQEWVWWEHRVRPAGGHNAPLALRLDGPLEVPSLQRSLGELVARHEVLRTTFHLLGRRIVQTVHPPPRHGLPLPVVDLQALPPEVRQQQVERLAARERDRPFRLAHDPMLRAVLLWLADASHVLLLTTHQIAFDDWSAALLVREFACLYEAFRAGSPSPLPPLPPLPLQYADFAVWQRRVLDEARMDAEFTYWAGRLAGMPALLDLPTDYPRPATRSFRAAVHRSALPAELTERLRVFCRRHGVTVFTALTAAFHTVLARYSGQRRFVTSTLTAYRHHPGTEHVIGDFSNLLLLPADLTGRDLTFRQLLRRTRDTLLEVQEHADMPAHLLAGRLRPRRDNSHNPVSQTMLFSVHATDTLAAPPLANLRAERISVAAAQPSTPFDIELRLLEEPLRIGMQLLYATDLFCDDTIARFAGHLVTLVGNAIAQPDLAISQLALPLEPAARGRDPRPAATDRRRVTGGSTTTACPTGTVPSSPPPPGARQA